MTPSHLPKPPPKAAPKPAMPAGAPPVSAPSPAKPASGAAPVSNPLGLPQTLAAMAEALQIYDSIVVEENRLLHAQDIQAVAALLERKQKATTLYQERLRITLSEKDAVQTLSPEQRQWLVDQAQLLQTHVEENAGLLRANMHAIERLFGAVNEAFRKERDQQVTYSAKGKIDGPPVSNSAIAFNSKV
ncbi:MAG TPA: hypothetical protein HPP80_06535 [Rhodospirillaceae bacterium]|nr:hypothetical protein [Rhodospirillaceae bacterium]